MKKQCNENLFHLMEELENQELVSLSYTQRTFHRNCENIIGVNITAFGRKLKLFNAIPLSCFSLKMFRFFAYFEQWKMRRSMRSVQRPVHGKANSLCKIVKCCVF